MKINVIISLLAIIFLSCNEVQNAKVKPTSSRDTTKDYHAILLEREKASSEKLNNTLGELVTTISFNVKADDKEVFEDGLIPWANIEKPENDIPQLVDGNKTVISESKVTIIIDYPLTKEYRFELESKNGFTREKLLKEISENYYKIYEEEESTAIIKTIPADKRTTTYNRNQTDGKYGIWGHDISDLVLSEISVYKTLNGQIILALTIES